MTELKEIEEAICALGDQDYSKLRHWFLERDWREWESRIESDSDSGKLDFLRTEALEEKSKGSS